MSLIAKEATAVKRDPIPAGIKTAVCSAIIDLGEQETKWKDKVKVGRKVMFIWEIPSETIETEDGTFPRTINKQFTLSLHERAGLRKMLQAWRGKTFTEAETEGFDLKSMLGQGCMLSVVHTVSKSNGNTYANVDSVMGLPDGVPAPKATHLISFDLDAPTALEDLEMLPEWIQNRIKESITYSLMTAEQPDAKPWVPDDPVDTDGDEDTIF